METLVPVAIALAALAAVLLPLLREKATPAGADPESLEAEVERYRSALRSGTICARCAEANPAGSRFCSRCGASLAEC